MAAPILVTNPKSLNLTKQYLIDSAREPIYVGTMWQIRMQVRDSAGARSLTGATIVMTITDGTNTITRHTGVTSAGASAAQIVIDADQVTEDTVNYMGKGWFTIRSDALAADITALTPFANRKVSYDVCIKFGDAITQIVLCEGTIELPKPKTTFPIT